MVRKHDGPKIKLKFCIDQSTIVLYDELSNVANLAQSCKLVYHVRDSLGNVRNRASNVLGESCLLKPHKLCYKTTQPSLFFNVYTMTSYYNKVFRKDTKAAKDKLAIDMLWLLNHFLIVHMSIIKWTIDLNKIV